MLDYRPDWDDSEVGISPQVINCIPTAAKTYRQKSNESETNYTTLGGTCVGTAMIKRTDGSLRFFAATPTRIFEADTAGLLWNNESRAVTYAPAGSWDFGQYGNVSLAASYENVLQQSTSGYGTNFTDVPGAPQGKHIVVNNNRVVLLNTQGYTGSGQDGWAASDIGDYTMWTPAATNNAANGRIISSGPIVAATALGGLLIAWKLSEMWIGTDNGPPEQITWQRLPGGRYGCISKYAWVNIDAGIIFVGPNDIWFYDGSRPRSIADGIRDAFFQSSTIYSGVTLQHDEINKNVIFYRNDGQTGWVYNYAANKWGRQSGYNGVAGANVYAVLNANNEDIYNFGSGILLNYIGFRRTTNFVFNSSNKLTNADGAIAGAMRSGTASLITTSWYGDKRQRSRLNRIEPILLDGVVGTSMTAQVTSTRIYNSNTTVTNFVPNAQEQCLDGLADDNFHQILVTMTSDIETFEVKDFAPRFVKAGVN